MDEHERKILIIALYVMTLFSLCSCNIFGVVVFGGTFYAIKNEKIKQLKFWYVGTFVNVILSFLVLLALLIWTLIYILCYYSNKSEYNSDTFVEFIKISISLLIIIFTYMIISIYISKNVKQYQLTKTTKRANSQNCNDGIQYNYRNDIYLSNELNTNIQYIARTSSQRLSLDTLPTYVSAGPSNSNIASSANKLNKLPCPSYSNPTINTNFNTSDIMISTKKIAFSTPTLYQSTSGHPNMQEKNSIDSLPPPYTP